MQSLVENIHKIWSINRDWLLALSKGKSLVSIDPALIVNPPPDIEEK